MPRLRIAAVIPGAVSLGAYEAGAAAALLELLRVAQGDVVLDTIVGASAGSITAIMLAHGVLTGRQGGAYELWVEQASLENLLVRNAREGRPPAPLETSALEEWAHRFLDDTRHRGEALQRDDVRLVMSVANLQGLRYQILARETPRAGERLATVPADTYRDARAFRLRVNEAVDWAEVVRTAAASAANAHAFAPVRLSRSRDEYPRGVEFPGEERAFWYTDGGTVYNEPFGFAIDAVYAPHEAGLARDDAPPDDAPRLFLLIQPHPSDAPTPWPANGDAPTFTETALRALSLSRAQSVYDDLRRLEKLNSRIHWRARLEALLRELEAREDDPLADALRALAQEVVADTARVREALGRPPKRAKGRDPVQALLDAATGTAGKRPARVEIVSPTEGRAGESPGRVLAGEPLGHFLGFASEDARRSDFELGYRDFAAWWGRYRDEAGLTCGIEPRPEFTLKGDFAWAQIPWHKRAAWVARLVPRYARELTRYASLRWRSGR